MELWIHFTTYHPYYNFMYDFQRYNRMVYNTKKSSKYKRKIRDFRDNV